MSKVKWRLIRDYRLVDPEVQALPGWEKVVKRAERRLIKKPLDRELNWVRERDDVYRIAVPLGSEFIEIWYQPRFINGVVHILEIKKMPWWRQLRTSALEALQFYPARRKD